MADQQTQRDKGDKTGDQIAELAAKIAAAADEIAQLTGKADSESSDDEHAERKRVAAAFFDGKNA